MYLTTALVALPLLLALLLSAGKRLMSAKFFCLVTRAAIESIHEFCIVGVA